MARRRAAGVGAKVAPPSAATSGVRPNEVPLDYEDPRCGLLTSDLYTLDPTLEATIRQLFDAQWTAVLFPETPDAVRDEVRVASPHYPRRWRTPKFADWPKLSRKSQRKQAERQWWNNWLAHLDD